MMKHDARTRFEAGIRMSSTGVPHKERNGEILNLFLSLLNLFMPRSEDFQTRKRKHSPIQYFAFMGHDLFYAEAMPFPFRLFTSSMQLSWN